MAPSDQPRASSGEAVVSKDLTIVNKKGLHARASAHFVRCAEGFDADITVSRDGTTVGGTSIMGLMMLAAGIGSVIRVEARGHDANAAVAALADLVADRFGEEE
ncbi:MAG TPA: HPr family phosphocarrier protein [Bauldia sp.]|nr:HPr family phosphocarrier protein [Bauldia sp.]